MYPAMSPKKPRGALDVLCALCVNNNVIEVARVDEPKVFLASSSGFTLCVSVPLWSAVSRADAGTLRSAYSNRRESDERRSNSSDELLLLFALGFHLLDEGRGQLLRLIQTQKSCNLEDKTADEN